MKQMVQFARLTAIKAARSTGCCFAMATFNQSITRQTALSQHLDKTKHLKGTLNCAILDFSATTKP